MTGSSWRKSQLAPSLGLSFLLLCIQPTVIEHLLYSEHHARYNTEMKGKFLTPGKDWSNKGGSQGNIKLLSEKARSARAVWEHRRGLLRLAWGHSCVYLQVWVGLANSEGFIDHPSGRSVMVSLIH